MQYILVKFEDNCGDEFGTKGFRIFTQEDYVEWLDRVNKKFEFAKKRTAEANAKLPNSPTFYYNSFPVEFYFGSNEQLQWYLQEDFHRSVWATLITKEQKDFLDKVFGDTETCGWGVFPDFDNDFDLDK